MKNHLIIVLTLLHSLSSFGQHVGYGSSTSTLTAKNQENIYMAFDLGFKKILGEKKTNEILLVEQDQTGSQLGALKSVESLIKKNVSAIFGFSGSHDSVLIGKHLKDSGLLIIVPGSNHNALKSFGPSVHTTGHSMDVEVSNTVSFLNANFANKKGLAIINQNALASSSIQEILIKSFPINYAYMTKDLKLEESDIKRIKESNIDYLYFTAYPEAMVNVANQLEGAGIDLPVIAASSWGLGDADLLRRFITNKKTPLYFSSEWNLNSKESRKFNELFQKKFGKPPSPENSLGYDLGIIAGTIISRLKVPISKKNIFEAFRQNLCFDGLSVGKLCFNSNGGHSDIRPRFYKFHPSGSILVK